MFFSILKLCKVLKAVDERLDGHDFFPQNI